MKINFLIESLLRLSSAVRRGGAWVTAAFSRKKHSVKMEMAPERLPQHIAVIMDGNGRWATRQGKSRIFGHQSALTAVREVIEGCSELGVSYLTLFAFSAENWRRPQVEVDCLMELITKVIDKELAELVQKNVRLVFIGDLQRLPASCQQVIQKAKQASHQNQGLQLTIALSYSGQWDVAEAVKAIVRDIQAGQLAPENIDAGLLKKYLATQGIPDPELLIRTSGEMRLSNFILWQLAYTELYFTSVLWPDFRKIHLYEAILAYQKRDRRFGKKLGK